MNRIVFAAFAALLTLLAGCAGSAPRVLEPARPYKAKVKKGATVHRPGDLPPPPPSEGAASVKSSTETPATKPGVESEDHLAFGDKRPIPPTPAEDSEVSGERYVPGAARQQGLLAIDVVTDTGVIQKADIHVRSVITMLDEYHLNPTEKRIYLSMLAMEYFLVGKDEGVLIENEQYFQMEVPANNHTLDPKDQLAAWLIVKPYRKGLDLKAEFDPATGAVTKMRNVELHNWDRSEVSIDANESKAKRDKFRKIPYNHYLVYEDGEGKRVALVYALTNRHMALWANNLLGGCNLRYSQKAGAPTFDPKDRPRVNRWHKGVSHNSFKRVFVKKGSSPELTEAQRLSETFSNWMISTATDEHHSQSCIASGMACSPKDGVKQDDRCYPASCYVPGCDNQDEADQLRRLYLDEGTLKPTEE